MTGLRVPGDGFRYLMGKGDKFLLFLQIAFKHFAARAGYWCEIDVRRAEFGHALWQNKVGRWKVDMQTRAADGIRDPDFSDLKLAGSLLWALNKVQPVQNIMLPTLPQRAGLMGYGWAMPTMPRENSMIPHYPNESLAFAFVYFIHCTLEIRREEKKRVNFADPPLTDHFLRNLCFMLRENSPNPLELYMIFKAFDLYGLELPA